MNHVQVNTRKMKFVAFLWFTANGELLSLTGSFLKLILHLLFNKKRKTEAENFFSILKEKSLSI